MPEVNIHCTAGRGTARVRSPNRIWIERPALKPVSAHQPDRKVQFPLLYPPEQSASPVLGELPNPLVPPFPPANLKAGSEAIQQGKTAKTQTPREAEYLAAIEVFYKDYDKIDHEARAERYEQAMQRLHEHYPDDSERRSFRHSRSTAQSTSMT